MKSQHSSLAHTPRHARGAALIVSLILLVLITLVGVASLRNVVLEERMSANYFDRSLAFQAAEAGLRAGEAVAEAQAAATPRHAQALALGVPVDASQCSSTCSGGLCAPPSYYDSATNETVTVCEGRWLMNDFDGWVEATGVTLTTQAGNKPEYFVEFLGNTFPCNPNDVSSPKDCARYRVTSRSKGGPERAEVILQSVYATE